MPALIALQLLLPVLALLLYLLRQGRAKVDRSTHTPGLKVCALMVLGHIASCGP